jgi:coenzyme PQQ precursor peptide PqqA
MHCAPHRICEAAAIMLNAAPSLNLQAQRPHKQAEPERVLRRRKTMAWTTPVIVEVCVGMEITSYESAEI